MAVRTRVEAPVARFAPLEAKLQAPRRRPGLVARYSLVDRLRSSTEDPIVYVSAPAGYGKTTLMAHWADADSRPFAWVSLDDGDNDPVALLTYVADQGWIDKEFIAARPVASTTCSR